MSVNEKPRLSGSEFRLLEYLRDEQKSRVRRHIADELGVSRSYVGNMISRLKSYGIVSELVVND